MRIVVVGAHLISAKEVEPLVVATIQSVLEKYGSPRIGSRDCDSGVGKIVKNLCLPGTPGAKPRFDFVETAIRAYCADQDFTRAEFAAIAKANNAQMKEWGEEFHLFLDNVGERGVIGDLVERLRQERAMAVIYKMGEKELREPKPLG